MQLVKKRWELPWWASGKKSAFTAGGTDSIPGQGTKIPAAPPMPHGMDKKKF